MSKQYDHVFRTFLFQPSDAPPVMLTVNRIGKHLGAEILGIDLSQPMDDDTFAKIKAAFFDNEVVFFRNQQITPAQQIAFTRRFGILEHHVR